MYWEKVRAIHKKGRRKLIGCNKKIPGVEVVAHFFFLQPSDPLLKASNISHMERKYVFWTLLPAGIYHFPKRKVLLKDFAE